MRSYHFRSQLLHFPIANCLSCHWSPEDAHLWFFITFFRSSSKQDRHELIFLSMDIRDLVSSYSQWGHCFFFYEVASELENFHTFKSWKFKSFRNDLVGKPCQIDGLISKNLTNATSKRVWLHYVAWICWTNEKKSNLQMNVHSNLFYFIYTWWVHTCSSLGLYSLHWFAYLTSVP